MDNIQTLTENHHTDDKRARLESDDGEFDEELALPDPISIIDIGDGPVAIALSDDEVESTTLFPKLLNGVIISFFSIWENWPPIYQHPL